MSDSTRADLSLKILPSQNSFPEYDWFHHWYEDSGKTKISSSVARSVQGYKLRYPGLADFNIRFNLKNVECVPVENVPQDSINHIFLDNVLPRILGQKGELIVHASAVHSPNGKGLAFLGESGWGKSTIASSFHQLGYCLLTDDTLKLNMVNGRIMGVPAYAGSRLWQDSIDRLFPIGTKSVQVSHYSGKRRVGLSSFASPESAEIHQFFFLDNPEERTAGRDIDEVLIQEFRGAEVVVSLIKRSFLLDIEDLSVVTKQFETACQIAFLSPHVFSLKYPHDYALLRDVMRSVEKCGAY